MPSLCNYLKRPNDSTCISPASGARPRFGAFGNSGLQRGGLGRSAIIEDRIFPGPCRWECAPSLGWGVRSKLGSRLGAGT